MSDEVKMVLPGQGQGVSTDRLVAMIAAYYSLPGKEIRERFPEYAALNLEVPDPMQEVMRFFCQTASAIEARRAETGTGSVHESAVPKADALTLAAERIKVLEEALRESRDAHLKVDQLLHRNGFMTGIDNPMIAKIDAALSTSSIGERDDA